MLKKNKLYFVPCASGIAGRDIGSGNGPLQIKQSFFLKELDEAGLSYHWEPTIQAKDHGSQNVVQETHRVCTHLAKAISQLIRDQKFFVVLGGDHSCAIGTWSGVYDALHTSGRVGLIWLDAHMDSHTPETSPSGRIHGMPLAALMGQGYASLTQVLHHGPKINPEHVSLIGVRSFEEGEAALLKKLNVKVYFMDEVKARGFDTVFQEAIARAKQGTFGYGISLDLDGLDPNDAPGVDVPESNGLKAQDILNGLAFVSNDPQLIGIELVEFDPLHDQDQKTEKLLVSFLKTIASHRQGF